PARRPIAQARRSHQTAGTAFPDSVSPFGTSRGSSDPRRITGKTLAGAYVRGLRSELEQSDDQIAGRARGFSGQAAVCGDDSPPRLPFPGSGLPAAFGA